MPFIKNFYPEITQIKHINKLIVIIIALLLVIKLIKIAENKLVSASINSNNKTNVMAIAQLCKLLVFIICAFIAADLFGVPLNQLMAIGGIGGIIVGFATKDIINNFFSGMVLYFEEPLSVGDFIYGINNNAIQGVVENINIRATKIRKKDGFLLIVPNSVLASMPIVNYSNKSFRKIIQNMQTEVKSNYDHNKIVLEMQKYLASLNIIDVSEDILFYLQSLEYQYGKLIAQFTVECKLIEAITELEYKKTIESILVRFLSITC